MIRATLAIAVVAAGCASTSIEGRFRDQPIVWRVDDARDIPEPTWRHSATVVQKVIEGIDPPPNLPAQNTNALDDVPDSTWFTNRLGQRNVTAEEAIEGPVVDGPPQGRLLVVEGKIEGLSAGFLIDDERGYRYLIKLDTPDNPEQQTANEMIGSRILWALGYNVPEYHLIYFARDDLKLAAGILYKDPATGKKVNLDNDHLDDIVNRAAKRADGRYRAVATRLLKGKRKGGWLPEGLRNDDPNDVVPHQYRRELRGLRVLCSWLGHTDMTRDNTLDMYVEQDGRGFLQHFLLDFGGAFGGQQSELGRLEVGWEHSWDLKNAATATMTFGLKKRAWEDQKKTKYKAIGYFSAEGFNATKWVEFEKYEPFRMMDRADGYWAAKLIMRFERPLLEAIVATGELSESGAADYLVDTLMARRDEVGRTYLNAVTALDEFSVEQRSLCAVDLSVKYGFAKAGTIERTSRKGAVIDTYDIGLEGRVCIPLERDGDYRILRLRARRGGDTTHPMQIHYKGGKRPRILGVVRVQ